MNFPARLTRLFRHLLPLVAAALALPACPGSALAEPAKPERIAGKDIFRVGDRGVVCTAERKAVDPLFVSMFDNGFVLICRDASSSVGKLYALRGTATERLGPEQMTLLAGPDATCQPAVPARQEGAPWSGSMVVYECRSASVGIASRIYVLQARGQTLVASGLAAYDSVLRLGIESLAVGKTVAGEIKVAVTGVDDPAILARVQAEHLDSAQAMQVAVSHLDEGSYAEAAEIFDQLITRSVLEQSKRQEFDRYLVQQAIVQSILGNRVSAAVSLGRVPRERVANDPVFSRFFRNVLAMYRLDANDPKQALAELDTAVPSLDSAVAGAPVTAKTWTGEIDAVLSQRLASDDVAQSRLSGSTAPLTPAERIEILESQGLYLRGVAHNLLNDHAAAAKDMVDALARFNSVRQGRIQSMVRLPADITTLLASIAEAEGNVAEAEKRLQEAVALVSGQYPDSAVLLAARARLAAFYVRQNRLDAAIAGYRTIVADAPAIPGGGDAVRRNLAPYFAALADRAEQPGVVAEFFLAAQALVRPGVAQTQQGMARQLSGGSDEAAALFHQALALGREVRALDAEIANIIAANGNDPGVQAMISPLASKRRQLAALQTEAQARLSGFPRFLVATNQTVTLSELQKELRGDEAYYHLLMAGGKAYAIWVTPTTAKVFRVDASADEIEQLVNAARDSIARYEGNQLITSPFDLEASRRLFVLLFAPVADQLGRARHLVFEPDGGMLKLPVNLLVTDQASLDLYARRQAAPDADSFDFTGIAWMGRSHVVTTTVSARAFLEVRALAPSRAPKRYLGFGQNTPLDQSRYAPSHDAARDPCLWPLSTWNHPVNGAELAEASTILGGEGNQVVTGDAFSDTAILARNDLSQFRIIQFATHGLVSAPRPGCPAEPQLVTSFGPGPSKGLLSFREIFDLHLDADTVILSACDTAGGATVDATRAAGITTGGNFALDGLVRAFVGAGARSIIASHWPVPDQFQATSRLMGGLFRSGLDHPSGEALQRAQIGLMDDPLTSHPYYWAAFAIVGDAAKPLATQ